MRNTITVKEAAKRWGITERRVTVLCKEGRIEGAYKKSRCWVIPAEAEKPVDSRVKTGAYRSGLKNNRHLSYGFLTGILRVAKESIFSGLNNLKVNFILDNQYSEYFGFTPEEVKAIACYYHAEEKYEKICAWYDGYRFGDSEIFNPWSVINYFSNRGRLSLNYFRKKRS